MYYFSKVQKILNSFSNPNRDDDGHLTNNSVVKSECIVHKYKTPHLEINIETDDSLKDVTLSLCLLCLSELKWQVNILHPSNWEKIKT